MRRRPLRYAGRAAPWLLAIGAAFSAPAPAADRAARVEAAALAERLPAEVAAAVADGDAAAWQRLADIRDAIEQRIGDDRVAAWRWKMAATHVDVVLDAREELARAAAARDAIVAAMRPLPARLEAASRAHARHGALSDAWLDAIETVRDRAAKIPAKVEAFVAARSVQTVMANARFVEDTLAARRSLDLLRSDGAAVLVPERRSTELEAAVDAAARAFESIGDAEDVLANDAATILMDVANVQDVLADDIGELRAVLETAR